MSLFVAEFSLLQHSLRHNKMRKKYRSYTHSQNIKIQADETSLKLPRSCFVEAPKLICLVLLFCITFLMIYSAFLSRQSLRIRSAYIRVSECVTCTIGGASIISVDFPQT